MLALPYSFHGPVSPADARLRRNHRRPSHTLTVDPSTGVETLYVRFAITASDPLASSSASSDLEASEGNNLIARSWDWAKTWIGPLVWDDSHHPGAYDPKLSNGLTASQLESKLERERQLREQLERSERQKASWTGWVANGLGNFVGTVVGSSLGGLRNLSGAATTKAAGSSGEGYFRRPRKPAYGEYTSAEVVAELQKVRFLWSRRVWHHPGSRYPTLDKGPDTCTRFVTITQDPKTGHFVYKQLFAAIPGTSLFSSFLFFSPFLQVTNRRVSYSWFRITYPESLFSRYLTRYARLELLQARHPDCDHRSALGGSRRPTTAATESVAVLEPTKDGRGVGAVCSPLVVDYPVPSEREWGGKRERSGEAMKGKKC